MLFVGQRQLVVMYWVVQFVFRFALFINNMSRARWWSFSTRWMSLPRVVPFVRWLTTTRGLFLASLSLSSLVHLCLDVV